MSPGGTHNTHPSVGGGGGRERGGGGRGRGGSTYTTARCLKDVTFDAMEHLRCVPEMLLRKCRCEVCVSHSNPSHHHHHSHIGVSSVCRSISATHDACTIAGTICGGGH